MGSEWEIVAELEWSSGGYEWDQSTVFRKPDGSLVGGHDGGCSCNYPFMDFSEADFMDVRTDRDIEHLVGEVLNPDPKDVVEFRRKVREAIAALEPVQ